jgi:hypothetical protein
MANVKRFQSQKDTGSEPKFNAEKDNSASNDEAVPQGVKRKLFCLSECECPEDASPSKNSDTREKQCSPQTRYFSYNPEKANKNYSKDNKISECFLYSLGGPATNRKLTVSNPYNWHGPA